MQPHQPLVAAGVEAVAVSGDPLAEETPPPLQVSADPQTHRTMRYSIFEGAFTVVFLNWTAGAVLTGYLLHFGAGPVALSLMMSIPLLAQVVAPFAAWIDALLPGRKRFVTVTAAIARGLWILPVLAPFFLAEGSDVVRFVLIILAVSSVFQAMAGVVWTSWMGDVVPTDRRGRYFGLRNGLLACVALVANLVAAWILDWGPAPMTYQGIFAVALGFAVVGIVLYGTHHEPHVESHGLKLREIMTVPLKDQNFRRFLVFALYWQAAVLLGAPFIYPYFLDHLGMSFTQIAIWLALASVLTLATGPLWGRVADRFGNKPVLIVATIIAGSLLPITWMMARPGDMTMIYVSAVVDAIAWGAIHPAMFNLSLATAPRERRVAYISVLSVGTGIAGFLGGLIAGNLLPVFRTIEFTVGDFEWTGYHWIFLLAGVMRVCAWTFLRPVHETHAWRGRDIWHAFRRWVSGNFPWR